MWALLLRSSDSAKSPCRQTCSGHSVNRVTAGQPELITDSNVYIRDDVMPKKKYSFYINDEQATGLKATKERDGVLESEQIRRAIDRWLEDKGVKEQPARRSEARRRPKKNVR